MSSAWKLQVMHAGPLFSTSTRSMTRVGGKRFVFFQNGRIAHDLISRRIGSLLPPSVQAFD